MHPQVMQPNASLCIVSSHPHLQVIILEYPYIPASKAAGEKTDGMKITRPA
jgi:hypothetical protein